MLKSKMLFAPIVFALFGLSSFAQTNTAVAAANSFYKFDRSHSQTFNRRNIDARKAWFSTELYSLFLTELKRENAYLKKNPTDKPYFGDGLPFQPIQENCGIGGTGLGRRLAVKPAYQKGNRAAVTATFAFPKPCKDADAVTYTIGLIKGKTGWVIDDVNYGEDRTLKEDLKRKEY